MKSIHIGLKVWSTNRFYLKPITDLKAKGFFDYIELFVNLRSLPEDVQLWKELDVPYLIHAPHSAVGLNLGDKNNEEKNRSLIEKVKVFEDELNALKIIFHPKALKLPKICIILQGNANNLDKELIRN